jgi:hypothetical protein
MSDSTEGRVAFNAHTTRFSPTTSKGRSSPS